MPQSLEERVSYLEGLIGTGSRTMDRRPSWRTMAGAARQLMSELQNLSKEEQEELAASFLEELHRRREKEAGT